MMADVLLCGGASCHLWFLICLLYVQILMAPIFAMLMQCEHKARLGYLFLVAGSLGLMFCSLPVAGFFKWFLIYPFRLLQFFVIGCGVFFV